MNSRAVARRPLDSDADIEVPVALPRAVGEVVAFSRPLTVLVLAPTLHAGAADAGALDLVRILRGAGHEVIVASNGGRLESSCSPFEDCEGPDFPLAGALSFLSIF